MLPSLFGRRKPVRLLIPSSSGEGALGVARFFATTRSAAHAGPFGSKKNLGDAKLTPLHKEEGGKKKKDKTSYANPYKLMDGRPVRRRPKVGVEEEGFSNGFMNLGIPHHNVKRLGFEKPSSIQQRAIPILLQRWNKETNQYDRESNSVVIHAPNGSGKSLSYLLPIFTRIDPKLAAPQALLVMPSEALARQLHVQVSRIVDKKRKVFDQENPVTPCFWSQPAGPRLAELTQPPLSLLGTFQHLPRLVADVDGPQNRPGSELDLSQVKYVVVDEADYVLSRANTYFHEMLARLGASNPMFVWVSATASKQVLNTAQRFATLSEPAVYASSKSVSKVEDVLKETGEDANTLYSPLAKTVSHQTVTFNAPVDQRDDALARIQLLKHLVGTLLGQPSYRPGSTILIFHHDLKLFSQYGLEDILRRTWNCTVSTLHEHASRSEIGKAFRLTRHVAVGADVILCNDIVSRGIDLKGVTHVINFMPPDNKSAYVHRSGRVGRLGGFTSSLSTVRLRGNTLHPQSGNVLTLVNTNNPEEMELMQNHLQGLNITLSPFKAVPVKQPREKKPHK